jgi:hypothetical protein
VDESAESVAASYLAGDVEFGRRGWVWW